MTEHSADAWLINTGWNGGAYGKGKRISLKYSRAIIDSIHDGTLKVAEYTEYPIFGLNIPKKCADVPDEILDPRKTWLGTADECNAAIKKLAGLFIENFKQFESESGDVVASGPKL